MMEEVFALFAKLQAELEVLQAQNAALEKENQELRARLGAAKPEPEPLKVYDSVEDIVWERGEHTANSYMLQVFAGKKYDTRPWKQVIVKDVGQVYRTSGNQQMPDWYAIAHHRVLDVTADPWVCLIQEGDDSFEEDPEDMRELVRNYQGGLRYSLWSWREHSVGEELRKVFLETHKDPGIVDIKKPWVTTPVPGELRPDR